VAAGFGPRKKGEIMRSPLRFATGFVCCAALVSSFQPHLVSLKSLKISDSLTLRSVNPIRFRNGGGRYPSRTFLAAQSGVGDKQKQSPLEAGNDLN
jgi:hypothetical protein